MSSSDFDDLCDKIVLDPVNSCSLEELKTQLKQCLRSFDHYSDSSGTITSDKLPSLCTEMGLPMETDEEEIMDKMDADGSGTLERAEWVEVKSINNKLILNQSYYIFTNNFNSGG